MTDPCPTCHGSGLVATSSNGDHSSCDLPSHNASAGCLPVTCPNDKCTGGYLV
jgi:hypothetical protein